VRRGTVGFDAQALLSPDEVALIALDVDVYLGARQPVLVADGDEKLLEDAPGTSAAP